MITQSRLKELLHYDPLTGVFVCRISRRRAKKGSIAGSVHADDGGLFYRRIVLEGQSYQAHRLAFLYMTGKWPIGNLDHEDGSGLNNRWSNLREATHSQNGANAKRPAHNTSGFKGVSWHTGHKRWQAYIQKDGKQLFLGWFKTTEEAHSAYIKKAAELFGEFARCA